jgi:small subunit ribosomal protein S6
VIRINAYEIMLMIEPEVAEERHSEIIERTKATVTEGGGVWGSVDAWGKRKLAYEIDHMGDAWYYVLTFESEPAALHEATRVLAITDGVMRHMATARPQRASGTPAPAEPEPAGASA